MVDMGKAIKGLECCTADLMEYHQDHFCDMCPYKSTDPRITYCFNKLDLMRDALSLLKAQGPRVMTLDEVKQHNNQDGCVWFEQPTYNADAAFVIQDEECTEIISPYILGEPINHGYWSNSNYNVTWRCWTSRPTDEQREAAPWVE